ncbi:VWA domain-containing protein [Luteitalea sp. TBR-22]|uniref:VWA domain-containing protein n=1 Tax=Luteitalea sp. TBR-22 TaxID=2802971 RepID=UPI001EF4D129|nr:VWA domain-containing protein [Luteitalea sp. TBR-22]
MHTRTTRGIGGLLVAVLALAPLGAKDQAPRRASGGDSASVTAVVVDLVVRDKKGLPVTDLTADDFEVLEDGVPQQVGSFRLPSAEAGILPATTGAVNVVGTTAAARPSGSAGSASVVALVFDRLSPDSRRLTALAADRYVGKGAESPHVTGVFATDWGLEVIQGFTRDGATIRAALDKVGTRTGSQPSGSLAESRADQQRVNQLQNTLASIGTGTPQAGAAQGAAGADLQMAQMQQRMSETYTMLERDQAGYGTMNALTAVVNSLKLVPGRKSVLFFSEGLVIPPNVMPRFLALIDEANRANVAVYAMDAKGLRAESTQAEARDEINAYAAGRLDNGERNIGAGGAASRYLERNEDRLRMDPSSGLGQLANETGGFLIAGSNNFDKGFTRVSEDIRAHYVLTYSSSKPAFDGKFRSISVKVKRPGLTVSHRKGYYAVPPSADGSPVLAYEAPGLALLESSPLPNNFPITARALVFPTGESQATVPVLVGFDTRHLDYSNGAEGFSAEAVVIARLRDANGQVLAKMSEQYTLSGAAAQLANSQAGRVVFFRKPVMPPGLYSLEAIVYDTHTAKSSVRISSLEVPAPTASPVRVSSLMIVQRAEKVPQAERDATNPLYFGETLLYPNLGEPLSKAATKEVAFAFTVQPGKSPATGATMTLVRSGQVIGQAPITLDAAGADGIIRQIGRLPIEALEPGSYEIRMAVQAGTVAVNRSARFTVAP